MGFRVTDILELKVDGPEGPVRFPVEALELLGDGRFRIEVSDREGMRYVMSWEADLLEDSARRQVTFVLKGGKEDMRMRDAVAAHIEMPESRSLIAYCRFREIF